MFSDYNDFVKNMEIKNSLASMGINKQSTEAKYFSDMVLELCLCMGISNNDINIPKTEANSRVLDRMDEVGRCLNNPFMNEKQREIVDEYIDSCELELGNFFYEIGASNIRNDLKSCAKKINHRLNYKDVLIIFSRSVYTPPVPKKSKVSKKKLKLLKK